MRGVLRGPILRPFLRYRQRRKCESPRRSESRYRTPPEGAAQPLVSAGLLEWDVILGDVVASAALGRGLAPIPPGSPPRSRLGSRLGASRRATAGAAVAHSLVLPIGLRFFLSLELRDMTSQWAVDEYIGFVLRLIFGFGIVFEMPVISLFLARLGLITADYLRGIRRYAVVVIFVMAAVFTPPDPLSQLMMALPLLGLYEISIWGAVVAGRWRKEPDDDTLDD